MFFCGLSILAAGGTSDTQTGQQGYGGGSSLPTKSLRLNSSSSSYLSRTSGTSTSNKKFTLSTWVKRARPETALETLFYNSASDYLGLGVGAWAYSYGIGAVMNNSQALYNTTHRLRDTTGWFHILYAADSTQSAAADRYKIWVNGVEVPTTQTWVPAQDADIGLIADNAAHYIGGTNFYLDGYLYEVHFIDGQMLTPSSFTETDSTSGVLRPKLYSGTYGDNGFRLDFDDSSDIGSDASGNSNDFTANNLSSHDVVSDNPTNNFATMNSLAANSTATLKEGNLRHDTTSSGYSSVWATQGMPSGKWYAEVYALSGAIAMPGVSTEDYTGIDDNNIYVGEDAHSWGYYANGTTYHNAASTSYAASYTTGDIVMIAFDADNGAVYFGKNGTWYDGTSAAGSWAGASAAYSSLSTDKTYFFTSGDGSSSSQYIVWNFGQDSTFAGNETSGGNSDGTYGDFKYSVPSGYKALCSANLSATIADPSKHFGAINWTGNGTNNNDAQAITGLGFQPDLVWVKGLSGTRHHELHDSIRGAGKRVFSSDSAAESDKSTLDSFDSDGFTVSIGTSGQDGTNANGIDYVGWCWKAGTAFDPSTGGSGTGGSKNADAGFSIVTWSGQDDDMESGSDTDVYHGLGVKPDLILIKNRTNNADGDATSDTNWCLWNSGLSGDDYFKRLNTSDDEQQWDSGYEGLKSIGTSTFTAANGQYDSGTYFFQNWEDMAAMSSGEADDYVAYCFANSDVFRTGVYYGNAATDGPVINTGFKPAMVWLDRIGSQSMHIMDSSRSPSNVVDDQLYPNSNAAEAADNLVKIDILSNGFKLRNSQTATNGTSSTKYLYYAFAEEHAKYSTAF